MSRSCADGPAAAILVLVLVVLFGACRGALAAAPLGDPAAAAAVHAQAGRRWLAQGDPGRALGDLLAAHGLLPLPGPAAALAEALTQAGRADEGRSILSRLRGEAGPQAADDLARLLRLHIAAGAAAFTRGEHDAAMQSFLMAYALRRLPRFLFNIAQAARRSGRIRAAALFYQRFLQEEADTPLSREARGYLREVQALLLAEGRPPPVPLHRRAWFWGVVGGAAATAAALSLGLGLGLGLSRDPVVVYRPEF